MTKKRYYNRWKEQNDVDATDLWVVSKETGARR